VALTFAPNGTICNVIHKKYLTPEEHFLDSGSEDELKCIETDWGKLAVLICADSWIPESYQRVVDADVIAVIAYMDSADAWLSKWQGYTIPSPDDVDSKDIGRFSECEMWKKYSLFSRMKKTKAVVGILSFLHGYLWDLRPGAQTCICMKDEMIQSSLLGFNTDFIMQEAEITAKVH